MQCDCTNCSSHRDLYPEDLEICYAVMTTICYNTTFSVALSAAFLNGIKQNQLLLSLLPSRCVVHLSTYVSYITLKNNSHFLFALPNLDNIISKIEIFLFVAFHFFYEY